MVEKDLRGIYAAMITPMHHDESINYEALRQVVESIIQDGAEGLYVCGSSGEGLLLSLEERKKVLETTLDQAHGRVKVIAHVGTIRTADVIDLAQHAKSAGVDAVSMIPPYYYKFTTNEICGYYEDVMKAVPDLPVIIYNIPQFTGVSFNKDNAGRLLENPQIAGVKHTSNDFYGLERMINSYPNKTYFNGFDEMYFSGLAAGANAAIGTTINLYAKTFLKLRKLFEEGKNEEAKQVQHLINRRVEITCHGGIFSAMKYGFLKKGIDVGTCRRPFAPLSEENKRELDALYAEGFDE